ncbi:carboxypeptidase [Candidatus Marinamargulisbacteria bacterium SCGC AG-439-L15]|nr:carboxypeptidase [Candidatus Marinamargulisbacteria bacterium SCGC AG-439-L15]
MRYTKPMLSKPFDPLVEQLREIGTLSGISALLGWDQETYMPAGAIDSRSEQQALMARLIHERHTGEQFKIELAQFVDLETGSVLSDKNSALEQTLLKAVYREWKQATALPQDFVETLSKTITQATHAWKDAKDSNTFAPFAPFLEQLVSLSKQKAEYIGGKDCAYDVLLDEYEPEMTCRELDPLFKTLRQELVNLLQTIKGSTTSFKSIQGEYDLEQQWSFGVGILKKMGYDFETGRQDKSSHPFTTGFHPSDIRITTRLDQHNFLEGFLSTIHEGGHGLYEQGLDPQWFGTPLSSAISLGIHESQSRLWENYVCKSRVFWEGHYKELQGLFPGPLTDVSLDEFYRSINQVNPGFIRVAADELTYNLHIMIRYEMEQAMFNGDVATKDLPELWAEKYQDYLGIRPKTVSDGILQDIHWSCGHFGYFPTYTLGNLYGRQLFDQAEKELPTLQQDIREGRLLPLREWLKTHIHQVGQRFSATELITQITGAPLSTEPFLRYLREKYETIYGATT